MRQSQLIGNYFNFWLYSKLKSKTLLSYNKGIAHRMRDVNILHELIQIIYIRVIPYVKWKFYISIDLSYR